jgi:Spy/CpxP family protein refolding chaperone
MKKITDLQKELSIQEQLTPEQQAQIMGGCGCDDKRRERPGGGSSTNSPTKRLGR